MGLSTYVGRMSPLKDDFPSIMPKSTNVGTSQSKTNHIFMILLLVLDQTLTLFENKSSLAQLSPPLMRSLLDYFAIRPLRLSPCCLRVRRILLC